jgi:hypothetical protein
MRSKKIFCSGAAGDTNHKALNKQSNLQTKQSHTRLRFLHDKKLLQQWQKCTRSGAARPAKTFSQNRLQKHFCVRKSSIQKPRRQPRALRLQSNPIKLRTHVLAGRAPDDTCLI